MLLNSHGRAINRLSSDDGAIILPGTAGNNKIMEEYNMMRRHLVDPGAKLCVNENWIGSFSLRAWNETHAWEGSIVPMMGLDFKAENLKVDDVHQLDFEYEPGRQIQVDIRITEIKPGRIGFEGVNPLPEATVE